QGIAICSNNQAYSQGQTNPAQVCVRFSATKDVCDPVPASTHSFQPCDNGHGTCLTAYTGFAGCFPTCAISPTTGAYVRACPNMPSGIPDGCNTDADCAGVSTGDKCDLMTGQCTTTCDTTLDAGPEAGPDAGGCSFGLACSARLGLCDPLPEPVPGTTCDPSASACWWCGQFNSTQNLCVESCEIRTDGTSDCPTNFACDPGLPTTGAGSVSGTLAVGVTGFCVPKCTIDSDCNGFGTGWICGASGGIAEKTCRAPADVVTDGGVDGGDAATDASGD
ncbi:MAG: hypothetical protein ACHREM_28805, partial [Polyangiales bacterium]